MTYLAFFQAFLTFTNVSRSHKTELRLFIHAMYWLYFLNVPFWQHFQWNTYNSIDKGACSSVDLVHQLITETMLTDIVTNHTNMCISKQTKSRWIDAASPDAKTQNHYGEKGTYTTINYGAAGGRVTT